jgi:hypothetical protein
MVISTASLAKRTLAAMAKHNYKRVSMLWAEWVFRQEPNQFAMKIVRLKQPPRFPLVTV